MTNTAWVLTSTWAPNDAVAFWFSKQHPDSNVTQIGIISEATASGGSRDKREEPARPLHPFGALSSLHDSSPHSLDLD